MTARAAIVAREAGTVAGVRAAELAFRLLDPAMACEVRAPDGTTVSRGQVVMQLDGSARALLSAERTALNFLCKLSGVATATAAFVQAGAGHSTGHTCTPQATPGRRALETAPGRAGGGPTPP